MTGSCPKGKVAATVAVSPDIPAEVIGAAVAAYFTANPPQVVINQEALTAAVKEHVAAQTLVLDIQRDGLTVKEFAARWGVSTDTVYRAARAGKLACVLVGGEKRIPVAELDRLTVEAYERVSA